MVEDDFWSENTVSFPTSWPDLVVAALKREAEFQLEWVQKREAQRRNFDLYAGLSAGKAGRDWLGGIKFSDI